MLASHVVQSLMCEKIEKAIMQETKHGEAVQLHRAEGDERDQGLVRQSLRIL